MALNKECTMKFISFKQFCQLHDKNLLKESSFIQDINFSDLDEAVQKEVLRFSELPIG